MSERPSRKRREPASSGFGMIEVLVLMAVAAAMMYYFQSTLLVNARFQGGLLAEESMETLASEIHNATRDFNYCAGMITITSGSVNSPNGANISIGYPTTGPLLAATNKSLPNVTLQSVILVMTGVPNLAEIHLNGLRGGGAVGGPITEVIPIYVNMAGNTLNICTSTAYLQKIPAPNPAPVPPYTVEDNACQMSMAGTTRFNPWPQGNPPNGYCS